jgi:predicted nucleotidyltransferase
VERVYEIAAGTGQLVRFVVFGSFVTRNPHPNDIDVFMIMDDEFELAALADEARLLFEHASAQDWFGCSAFWIRRQSALGGEQNALEDWQIKRDGARRGIVEIVGEGR